MPIRALGHAFGDWTPLDENQHQIICAHDPKHIRTADHTWDAGVVTKEATEAETGVKTLTCSLCGQTKTEVIPVIDRYPASPTPAVDPSKQYGEGNSPVGKGASIEAAEAAIAAMTGDSDLPGTVFNKLQLRSKKQTKTSITLSWKKVSGAEYYVIYGNKCGKANKMKRLAKSTAKTRKLRKVLGKKVKKETFYKFMIIAYDKDNKVVSSSRIIHVAAKGGKVTNPKKVTVKNAKKAVSKITVKKGKTVTVKNSVTRGSARLRLKTHRKVEYESSKMYMIRSYRHGYSGHLQGQYQSGIHLCLWRECKTRSLRTERSSQRSRNPPLHGRRPKWRERSRI